MEAQLFRFLNLQSAFSFFPIQVSDSKTQNLIPLFPQITTFINDTLRRDGKILVCCNGGMSRSPAVVIAYMMETFNLDASEAYQYVQSRRLCINPNDAFKTQIAVCRRRENKWAKLGYKCFNAHGMQIGVWAYIQGKKKYSNTYWRTATSPKTAVGRRGWWGGWRY